MAFFFICVLSRCLRMCTLLNQGSGSQSPSENRAQFLLWVILGSPLIMGNDIRTLDNFTVALVTSPEVLAVNQVGEPARACTQQGAAIWLAKLLPLPLA